MSSTEQERNELLQVLREMVQEHCAHGWSYLNDYNNPANRQALALLEKMGTVRRSPNGRSYEWVELVEAGS